MQQQIKKLVAILLALFVCAVLVPAYAAESSNKLSPEVTIDRLQLVTQQINLLTGRLSQSQQQLSVLQRKHDKQIIGQDITRVTKSILDKATLDISVAKSNLDSVNIEIADTQQTIDWLEKSIQEIENQLNVLSMFGLKVAKNEMINPTLLREDLAYQQKLLTLEKKRYKYLQHLQSVVNNILVLRSDDQNRLNTVLKSRNLLNIKQEQVRDELIHQEEQNVWLQKLNIYYSQLSKLDPVKEKPAYTALERDIYYANEKANYAYVQSLIARYDDQIQQMKLAVLRGNSISLLNEIGAQVQVLKKQIDKLDAVLKSRINVLDKHVVYITARKKDVAEFQLYIKNLNVVSAEYKAAEIDLDKLKKALAEFRVTLDRAMQIELSARQGLPIFGVKSLFDLGKELLLVPALTFQIMKSLSNSLVKGFETTGVLGWCVFLFIEAGMVFAYYFLKTVLSRLLTRSANIPDKLNYRWLSLQWFQHHFIDLFVIGNLVLIMQFFGISIQNYRFIAYTALVWVLFKSLMIISRLCLVETTHHTAGSDMRLYHRLKWIILVGGVITTFTVFIHQLPLIYELKTLFDRLFLLLTMVVSLLLLRSWDVVPNLILSHMEGNHPYIRRSIRLIGILVPLLMLGNAIIGVCGYVNLIMTVSRYEGLFLIVLVGYLILRGILSDAMEQLSRLLIQYVHNGWLWTEAFLKPLDKVLRITLFLVGWAVLFLLYGWDKQSPIVERLTRLLHYQIVSILNTTITPISILELFVVISVFYWTAKWMREFVYRLLLSRTKDMGLRNSIAILSQYTVVVLGIFICLRVLGINLQALALVSGMFAFGIGLGLRDLANNFACGFLILLERPLRVGDIVNINNIEGEVTHIGSRAVTVRTWDYMELVVPNAEIFNKSFTNWTSKDNIVRSVLHIKIGRHDNPHEVKAIIQNVLAAHKDVLKEPVPEVFLKDISDTLMDFEIRYFVNIRQVKSRTSVISNVLMNIWDAFASHGIKTPYPQQEIVLRRDIPALHVTPAVSEGAA